MILGIDLGATNTVGCVWDGKLRMIEITSGGATSLPSVVTIANGEALVGQAAIEAGIPAHVLSASLYARFASRNNDEFANRVLSAMRYKFGGHNEKPQAGNK